MKAVVLCAFAAFLAVANAQSEDCPDFCLEVYQPVCGSDGVQQKTFQNKCKMLQFNCKRGARFSLVKNTDCEESDRSVIRERIPGFIPGLENCPDKWIPVCGSDGTESKTFPNECIMRVMNKLFNKEFRALRSGPCKDSDLPDHLRETAMKGCGACPQIYSPVCATDGHETRTFPNSCRLRVFNCETNRNFVQTKSGAC